jgi:hypothetical protein
VCPDLERWLAVLPGADEEPGDGLVLSGRLAPAPPGRVRLVTRDLSLAFHADDVLDLESSGAAGEVRLLLRRGAALVDARPAPLEPDAPAGRRPFALATRPRTLTLAPAPRFRALERAFLERLGREPPP